MTPHIFAMSLCRHTYLLATLQSEDERNNISLGFIKNCLRAVVMLQTFVYMFCNGIIPGACKSALFH